MGSTQPTRVTLFRDVDETLAWLRRVAPQAVLRTDSRQVLSGDVFIAWPGLAQDGRRHVPAALAAGAAACLVEADGIEAFDFGADARIDRDDRHVLPAHRGHVVDASGAGQALLQGLGDIALDGFGVGARIGGGHRDQGVFHLRVLADGQFVEGLQAEQHDQQTDHRGQHWATDKGIGKSHEKRSLARAPNQLAAGWLLAFSLRD